MQLVKQNLGALESNHCGEGWTLEISIEDANSATQARDSEG